MARSFSEREKDQIRKGLVEACQKSWTQLGYKKTSVDDLCRQAGISKGAFYLFFQSKEDLFCEVLCSVQKKICEQASGIIAEYGDRYGVVQALKMIYRQYDENNFLYYADHMDYRILMNKLSEKQAKRVQESNIMSQKVLVDQPHLTLKIDREMALSVIYSLLMNVKNRDVLLQNHIEVFDFMVENLIERIYE